jgi:UPF0755 protein
VSAVVAKKRKNFILLGMALLALLFGAIYAASYVAPWFINEAGTPSATYKDITVKRGSTLSSVANDLEQARLIRSKRQFLLLAKLFGGNAPVKAGEYRFHYWDPWSDYLKTMQSGVSMQRLITIPEGMPSILVHDRLVAEPLLTGAIPIPVEGSILPDSYSFERGEARAAVLKRMQRAMQDALDEAWKTRTPASAVKSKREALILASIVEKETGIPSERPQVAAVYTNRLRQGMKLQADPTTIYPITKGKPLGRRIRRSELDAVNGYNTYAIAGLPQGPIANPGRDSILAVLAPPHSKALYFVADGKGGHVFAETLAQHDANVARYYAIRRQRGEM